MVVDPLVSTLLSRELVLRFAPRFGDSTTPVIEQGAEEDRETRLRSAKDFVEFLKTQSAGNESIVNGWIAKWLPPSLAAIDGLLPLLEELGASKDHAQGVKARLLDAWAGLMAELRLTCPTDSSNGRS